MEIDPKLANEWNNKGFALDNLGKYNEAIEYLDKAFDRYVDAWYNNGVVLDNSEKKVVSADQEAFIS